MNHLSRFATRLGALVLMLIAVPAWCATLTVTSNADSGTGSLRNAIASAASGDTIKFNGNMTITLASTLTLDRNLTIDASGQVVAVDGNNAVRVFFVNPGVTAQLTGLTIQRGAVGSDYGGGIFNEGTLTLTDSTLSGNSAHWGGGILNRGTLTLIRSTLSANVATIHGGGIFSHTGTLTVTHSTLSGNSAGRGGGISNLNGTLTVTHSTLSGNSAGGGGGISNDGGALTVTHSTLSGNSAGSGGGISSSVTFVVDSSTISGNTATNFGGGIECGTSAVTVTRSIVAGNTQGDGDPFDIYPPGLASGSFDNLIRTNPRLGALADNGGPTQTMLPQPGSMAINAIACTGAAAADQRGIPRPQGVRCDIGALEVRQYGLNVSASVGGSVNSATPAIPHNSNGIVACSSSGGTCGASFAEAAAVALTATPATGYLFSAWGGDCSGATASTTLTMDAAKTCTATFAIDPATATHIVAPTPTAATIGASVNVHVAVSRTSDSAVPVTGTVSVNNLTDGATCQFTPSATEANNFCTLTMASAGSKTLSATFASADTTQFADSTSPPVILQVNLNTQTLAFTSTAPTDARVNGPSYSVSAVATSGLPVAFSLDASSTACTLSGSTVAFTAAGSCVINANQAGDATYAPAPTMQQAITVGLNTQTLALTVPSPVYLNQSPVPVTATASSALPVTLVSTSPAICSVSGSAPTFSVNLLAPGNCSLTASQQGDVAYAPVSRNASIDVLAAVVAVPTLNTWALILLGSLLGLFAMSRMRRT